MVLAEMIEKLKQANANAIGLLSTANAKTGKTDANLTDAVNTLLEGYGKGGESGECSGVHINVVDELPALGEGVEGAYYGVRQTTLGDVYVVSDDANGLIKQIYEEADYTVYLEETTVEEFESPPSGYDLTLVYVPDYPDSPDIFVINFGITSFSQMVGVPFKGEITDTAQATEQGYYAYMVPDGLVLYQYINGEYRRLVKIGGLEYTSNGDGTCYVSGIEKYHEEEIVIPSIAPSGDTVTGIVSGAFDGCLIRNITIPDSVTSVSGDAFDGCDNLIQIENGVSYVDKWIIECDSSITSVSLRENTVGIGTFAFYGVKLTSITIPDSVTSIDDWALSSNDLTSITFGENSQLTNIGHHAFYSCDSLTSITFPDSVASIGESAFEGCYGLTSITIPDSVTSIGNMAFRYCTNLTSITFTGTVEQWNAITKNDGSWNDNVPATKVTCTDGEVTL